jgi:hypothetical protein
MLRLLQSFFGGGEAEGGYPESLVREATERAVDGTDPCLRLVTGYKKLLRPAVISALDHVIALVDSLPPPLAIDLGCRGNDPLLKSFFMSAEEVCKVLKNDRTLAGYLQGASGVPDKAVALMALERCEKIVFGAEMSGDVIERNVPRLTVSFESQRFMDPSPDQVETRRLLKRRAYDHLISLALKRITMTKTERKELARRHALLQSKLNLLLRGGWGFEGNDSADIPALEEQVGRIESQLMHMGGDYRVHENTLDILAGILGKPHEHLWGEQETLILDGMGVKRDQVSSTVHELTFNKLFNSEGRMLVMALVTIPCGELARLS